MEDSPKNKYCVSRVVDTIKNLVSRNSNAQKSTSNKATLKIKLGKIENGYLLESDYKQLNSLFTPGIPMFGYDYDLLSHIEVTGLKLDSGREIAVEGVLPVVKLSQLRTEEGKTIKLIHIKGRLSRKCPLMPKVHSNSFMNGTRMRKDGTLFRPPVTISQLRNSFCCQKTENKKLKDQFTQTSRLNVDKKISAHMKKIQLPEENEKDDERRRFKKKRRPTGYSLEFKRTSSGNTIIQSPNEYEDDDEVNKQFRRARRQTELSLVSNHSIDLHPEKKKAEIEQAYKKTSEDVKIDRKPDLDDEINQIGKKNTCKKTSADIKKDKKPYQDDKENEISNQFTYKRTSKDLEMDQKPYLDSDDEIRSQFEKKNTYKRTSVNQKPDLDDNDDEIRSQFGKKNIKEKFNVSSIDMVNTSKSSHISINSYSEYETVNSADSFIESLLFFNNKSQCKEKEEMEKDSTIQEADIFKSSENITECSPSPKSITITRSKKRYVTLSNGEELVEKSGDEILTVGTCSGDHQIIIKDNRHIYPNNVFTSDDYFNQSDLRLDKQLSWLEKLVK